MLENELEKKLRDKVKKLGGKAYKFVSPGNAGVPDRLVVLPRKQNRICRIKKTRRTTKEVTISTNKIFTKTWSFRNGCRFCRKDR